MHLPELWLLHPIAVHFPIVLLNLGLLTGFWGKLYRRPPWAAEAASWLLWLGTASAWAAMGLGLLAEKTAPHVPAAWQALDHHQDFAYWTVGVFTALSLLRWWRRRLAAREFFPLPLKSGEGRVRVVLYSFVLSEQFFLAAWFISCGLLVTTAYFGGRLVYDFGMGVNTGN